MGWRKRGKLHQFRGEGNPTALEQVPWIDGTGGHLQASLIRRSYRVEEEAVETHFIKKEDKARDKNLRRKPDGH